MPTYRYQCFSCNYRFEVFQKISDDPVGVCPSCKSNSGSVKRLLYAAPFHLKGSGWYKTDYSSSSSGSSPSPAPSTASPAAPFENKLDKKEDSPTAADTVPSDSKSDSDGGKDSES
jgi:putative FmdB family regulatory protein